MKKFYTGIALIVAFLMMGGESKAQVCNPDTANLSSPDFYPNPLPNGCVGVAYSEVVSFLFPNDTTLNVPPFGSLTIPFDSFVVSAVNNIPAGLTYACNVGGNCTYVTNPPNPTYGCVLVSGTPTAATSTTDSIEVVGTAWITILGSPTSISDTVRIGLLIETCSGILAANQPTLDIAVAPNPATGATSVRFDLPNSAEVNVTVLDILGRTVMNLGSSRRFAGVNEVSLEGVSSLPAGVYSVKVELDNGAVAGTEKIIVVN